MQQPRIARPTQRPGCAGYANSGAPFRGSQASSREQGHGPLESFSLALDPPPAFTGRMSGCLWETGGVSCQRQSAGRLQAGGPVPDHNRRFQ